MRSGDVARTVIGHRRTVRRASSAHRARAAARLSQVVPRVRDNRAGAIPLLQDPSVTWIRETSGKASALSLAIAQRRTRPETEQWYGGDAWLTRLGGAAEASCLPVALPSADCCSLRARFPGRRRHRSPASGPCTSPALRSSSRPPTIAVTPANSAQGVALDAADRGRRRAPDTSTPSRSAEAGRRRRSRARFPPTDSSWEMSQPLDPGRALHSRRHRDQLRGFTTSHHDNEHS